MPTKAQAHIDRALTNISVAYMQDETAFIADKVFPRIPVKKQSDVYFIYNKGDMFRDEARERGRASESVGSDYGVEASAPYYCKVYSFHSDVTEQDRANFDDPLDADRDATDFVSHKTLLKRETQWAEKYFKTGVWTTEITGQDQSPSGDTQTLKWTNPLSDPIKDITVAAVKMAEKTGYKPNKLVLSPYAYNALCNHEVILDRIKFTQKGLVSADLLASLFGVEEVLVAWGIVNNASQGAEENMSFIMGKHALLCYANPRPSLKRPSAGYIFTWTGYAGASAYGSRIVRLPMDQLGLGTERIEAEVAFDAKVIANDLGVFFNEIV